MKYDAFGNVTWMDAAFATKSSSGYAWNRTFTGQVRDSELGLMLYRNRYYSTGLGRFINRDSIGYLAGDTNLYRYCFNMPVDGLDPLGLQTDRTWGEFFFGESKRRVNDPNSLGALINANPNYPGGWSRKNQIGATGQLADYTNALADEVQDAAIKKVLPGWKTEALYDIIKGFWCQ